LRPDELTAVAVLQGFQQQARGQSGFPDAGFPDQYDVFCFGDEVQFGEGLDLFAIDSGLASEGEAGQRPLLGQLRLLNAPRQRCLLAVVPLGPQQAGEELGVRHVFLLGCG
jgi:hypothetical protein